MQNKSNILTDKMVPGRWLTNFLVDLGELYLRANLNFLSPRAIHSSSSVLVKAFINNRNRTGAMISPCLIPTLKSMDV